MFDRSYTTVMASADCLINASVLHSLNFSRTHLGYSARHTVLYESHNTFITLRKFACLPIDLVSLPQSRTHHCQTFPLSHCKTPSACALRSVYITLPGLGRYLPSKYSILKDTSFLRSKVCFRIYPRDCHRPATWPVSSLASTRLPPSLQRAVQRKGVP